MAKQGAALQTYNNELVKSLEELCQRRHALQVDIHQKDNWSDDNQGLRIRIRLELNFSNL